MTTPHGEALNIAGASKNYGPTRALSDVSFAVRHGRIHALLGGNGSGKSTLVKVLAGVVRPEPGGWITRTIGDRTVRTPLAALSASASRELGFRFVHQDAPIFAELSIAENLALGSMYERGPLGISWRRQYARAGRVLAQFGLDASPKEPVSGLAPAARTLLAIVRTLQDQTDPSASVLVLDEPTATLPRKDVSWLLASLRRLADQGQTILWVSHRLDEVCQAADDVTVLRDGKHVATGPLGQRTTADLAELIVGHPVSRVGTSRVGDTAGRVLEVRGLSAGPVNGVDLNVSQGEIVGVVGLIGSGRSSLLRAIYGALPRRAGAVTVAGKPLRGGHIATARALGVRFLPEERGLIGFSDMSIAMNASAPDVRRFWRGWINRRDERRDGEALIAQFGVVAPSADAALHSLSGGNQQKVLVGAAIRSNPTVLLVDEPTHGVDVGARADIHALIKQAISGRGCAVVVSSDIEEVVDLCDRVLILAGGEIVTQLVGDEITELAIASHMEKGTDTTQPGTPAETIGRLRE